MNPIDYTIDVATPFQAAAQGYQLGAGIRDDQAKVLQQQTAQQQAMQQRDVINALITNPAAGAKDYANAALLVPGLREQLKQAWDQKNTAQQESSLRDAGQWFAAVKNGRPDLAVEAMRSRAQAMKAAGANPQEIRALNAHADIIESHPEFGRTQLGMLLASIPGGDKVLAGATTMGTEERAAAVAPDEQKIKAAEAKIKGVEAAAADKKVGLDLSKTQAEIKNVESQIADRSKRLALDQDKLTSDVQIELAKLAQKNGEVPEFVAKDINEATVGAISAQQSAAKMNDLARQFEKQMSDPTDTWGFRTGSSARFGEWLAATTGNQNEMTRLRAEFNRIVTPAAMAAYKKVASGSTSDKDIETAMIGVPKDTANPETLAAFLRGAAKLQVYDAVINNAKAEWLGAVKNLGKAPKDMEIDGVKVPAGTTFKVFTDQYVPAKVEKANADAFVQSLASKYGSATPTPNPTVTSGRTPGFN